MTEKAIPTIDQTQRRHRWNRDAHSASESNSGCEETHRGCEFCPVVKITVHPPRELPYRAWILRTGERVADNVTPACIPTVAGVRG